MQKSTKASCQKHLSTIRDEVCSLSRMVDEDRYGIDIVKQISAVRDGLQRVRDELLRDHVARSASQDQGADVPYDNGHERHMALMPFGSV
jgi:DNA-binding FrmR family transcriptional regulator